jgi:hypothetical protein
MAGRKNYIAIFLTPSPRLELRTLAGYNMYRGADKSFARPTSRCILFDGKNISFDASLVIYINSNNIPPIMIINRIYENQNLLVFWPCIIVLTWIYHQLNAQFYLFYNNITSWSSTCFEHRCAHLQEDICIFTVSGIVTLCMLPYSAPIKSG